MVEGKKLQAFFVIRQQRLAKGDAVGWGQGRRWGGGAEICGDESQTQTLMKLLLQVSSYLLFFKTANGNSDACHFFLLGDSMGNSIQPTYHKMVSCQACHHSLIARSVKAPLQITLVAVLLCLHGMQTIVLSHLTCSLILTRLKMHDGLSGASAPTVSGRLTAYPCYPPSS